MPDPKFDDPVKQALAADVEIAGCETEWSRRTSEQVFVVPSGSSDRSYRIVFKLQLH